MAYFTRIKANCLKSPVSLLVKRQIWFNDEKYFLLFLFFSPRTLILKRKEKGVMAFMGVLNCYGLFLKTKKEKPHY